MCSSTPPSRGPLPMLAAAAEALDGEDLDAATDAALATQMRGVWVAICRLQAQLSRRVAVFDERGAAARDGARGIRGWLRHRLRLDAVEAGRQATVATALVTRPAAAAAYLRGEISIDHMAAIDEAGWLLGDDALARGVERILLHHARREPPGRLRRLSRRFRERAAPRGAVDAFRRIRAHRFLDVVRAGTGAVNIRGQLDVSDGELLLAALRAVRSIPPAPGTARDPAQGPLPPPATGPPELSVPETDGLGTGGGFGAAGYGAAGFGAAGYGAAGAGGFGAGAGGRDAGAAAGVGGFGAGGPDVGGFGVGGFGAGGPGAGGLGAGGLGAGGFGAGGPDAGGGAEPSAPERARADALVALCRAVLRMNPAESGRGLGDRARVVVTVPLETLRDDRAAVGEALLGSGEPVPAAVARRLACDARVLPAVLGGAGEVLDIGVEAETVTQGLRRAVELRDRGCRFPGCDLVAADCEAHHLVHWASGGQSIVDNVVLLCPYHHGIVHEGGWQVTRDPYTGTVRARRPDGTRLDTVSPPPADIR